MDKLAAFCRARASLGEGASIRVSLDARRLIDIACVALGQMIGVAVRVFVLRHPGWAGKGARDTTHRRSRVLDVIHQACLQYASILSFFLHLAPPRKC